jgi:phospholipid/cholesterol/gamma-HCH transport system substrate-binding protein
VSIRKPLIGFSLFAIVSILLTWVIWETLQRAVDGDTRSYSATFGDVLGLHPGDDVRMAGVRVGKVENIEIDKDNNARVDFVVESDQQVFSNTKALVRYQNLIGQRFVALNPGEGQADPLESGGEIPMFSAPGVRQTEDSFDVSALLGGFEPLFQSLDPAQVNNLSETLILALQGDGVSLSSFITQAASLANEFQQRDVLLGDVITNLSGVMSGLANRSGSLETLLAQTRALIGGLYAQGETLKNSTDQISDATTSLVGLVTQIRPALEAAQSSTNAAFNVFIANGSKLDLAGVDGTEALTAIARFTSDGAYANSYVCTLDVSLWGVLLPRPIFKDVGDLIFGQQHSEVCR